jgi:hypothetical protein
MDDFDPRINVEVLKPLHEEFVKRSIPFTIAVNSSMGDAVNFQQEVLDYVNNTDPATWDIQLHNFSHDCFWSMRYSDIYVYLYANLMKTKQDFPHSNPTVLYPPWNQKNDIMERAAKDLGLTIEIAKRTIREFLQDWGQGDTLFFWHWWTKDDRDMLPDSLDKLLKINNSHT